MAYRHGLRVSELIDPRLKDIDLDTSRLFVPRKKGSLSTHQPIEGDELRALRAWLRKRSLRPDARSPYLIPKRAGTFHSTGDQLHRPAVCRREGEAPLPRPPAHAATLDGILPWATTYLTHQRHILSRLAPHPTENEWLAEHPTTHRVALSEIGESSMLLPRYVIAQNSRSILCAFENGPPTSCKSSCFGGQSSFVDIGPTQPA
jgi:hypothetical protein